MSILSRLFGFGSRDDTEEDATSAKTSEPLEYKNCIIVAAPRNEEGQWRVAGMIEKQVGDTLVSRPFVRADLCTSRDEAIDVSRRKAQQIIDQNPWLFDDPENDGPV